jgi:hypothetical protein
MSLPKLMIYSKPILAFIIAFLPSFLIVGQTVSWSSLPPSPEPVSNNAVTLAYLDGAPYVYSFAGIDTSKDWFGIHLRSFRYNVNEQSWDTIAPLPDPNGGKIAAAASTVNNKIYIIGGYHVSSNYSEVSSSKVHIYDPETNTYLADGQDIPVPIDDQVQAVWRDSLIYVITGWSNSNNVTNVQIYNPSTDIWLEGTPVPNSSQWKVFGASGYILNDTIYYLGGARFGFNFPPSTSLHKGYINPESPTQITWTTETTPIATGYRMAAARYADGLIWLGGSDVTYNFDGIAYNGSGGVAALGRIKLYEPSTGLLTEFSDLFPPTMDLRGIAELPGNQYILAGGMTGQQAVSDQTLLITIDALSADNHPSALVRQPLVYPNPADDFVIIHGDGVTDIMITDCLGRTLMHQSTSSGQAISLSSLKSGLYSISLLHKEHVLRTQLLCIQH